MNGNEQDLTKSPGIREQYAAGLNWLALLCQALEASVVVFIRRGFGVRYIGGQAAAVIPVVLVYSLFWQGYDVRPVWGFLGLYLLACIKARFGSWRAVRRGEIQHTFYSGFPNIMRWGIFRNWLSEQAAKGFVEPLMVFLIGVGCMPYSEPLGAYLMLAAGGSLMSVQLAVSYQRQRVMDVQDAYLAQRADAEQFRDGGLR